MTFTQIQEEARRLSKSDSASYPIADLTASSNRALERLTSLIRKAEGRWQMDDSNFTDLPFARTNIVSGVGDYTLDPTHYAIQRVEIRPLGADTNTFTKLIPFDVKDPRCQGYTTLRNTLGTPIIYDKVGTSLILAPMPNYDQEASLRVYYERGPDYFTVSDTTKPAGINPLFHRLISYWAAYDFAVTNRLANTKDLRNEIALMESEMLDWYSQRDKDEHIGLRARNYGRRGYGSGSFSVFR